MPSFRFSLLILACAVGCSESTPSNGTSGTPRETRGDTSVVASKPVTSNSTHAEARTDNTKINERDTSDSAKTPIDQNENQKDIDITAGIRKRVVNEKMSTYAHNAKIITADGKVTLRGPVATTEERSQIETIAKEVAGSGNVDNQLDVQP
ncbi:BON domain-containing protein [Schlesneria paludicola]|uniref:BON domain-containing protein n=1 Tax=Schlesneria paludicola TaxID=360056 RepID=UPI00029AB5EC